jgi:hypothetical protein
MPFVDRKPQGVPLEVLTGFLDPEGRVADGPVGVPGGGA